jgi:hypothetical protein
MYLNLEQVYNILFSGLCFEEKLPRWLQFIKDIKIILIEQAKHHAVLQDDFVNESFGILYN